MQHHNVDTIHRAIGLKFDSASIEPDHLVNRGGRLGMVMSSSTDYTFWMATPYTNMAHFERDFDALFRQSKAARFHDRNNSMMALAIPYKPTNTSRGYVFFTAREIDDPDNDGQKLTKLLMPLGRLDTNADYSGLEYRFYRHHPDGSGFWSAPEDDWHISAALKATDHNILSTIQLISKSNLRLINSRSEANAHSILFGFLMKRSATTPLSRMQNPTTRTKSTTPFAVPTAIS